MGRHTRASGRMARGTDLGSSPEVGGSTGASGRQVSRDDTGSGSPCLPPPNTKGLGRMDCRTDTVQRLMRTLVSENDKEGAL